jgi:hypothetical protein
MPSDPDTPGGGPRCRVRLNLGQREFEVEGGEAFVRELAGRYEELLQSLGAPADPPAAEAAMPPVDGRPLGSFGEFIQRLPGTATEVDRMLAAGYFVQRHSGDDAFTTADANRRLAEQGIKLGNPSQCVRQSLGARRVFAVQRGRFRVSQLGRQHLRQMIGADLVPE